jgi:ketosteroid isomerase-like protein
MMPPATATPLDVVHEQYARLREYDLEGWKALVHPDIEFVNSFGAFHGPEQAGAFVKGFLDAFTGLDHEIIHTVAEGDSVAVELYFVGTHSAPLMTPSGDAIPASGRAVRSRLAHVLTVRDGRIATYHGYFDPADLMRQLGPA